MIYVWTEADDALHEGWHHGQDLLAKGLNTPDLTIVQEHGVHSDLFIEGVQLAFEVAERSRS